MATNPIQPQEQNPITVQPTQSSAPNTNLPDDVEAVSVSGSVNLARAYSRLNEAVRKLFDSLGVTRSASIPHLAGQDMSEHISDVGRATAQAGGVGSSLLTATHSMHDADGGSTVGHHVQKLVETTIPKDFPEAIAAIADEKSFISKCAFLLGDDDPTVKVAQSQIKLIAQSNLAGMSAFDVGVGLLALPGPMIQKIAQLHSEHKHGGVHPVLTAPKVS